jgi:hypothetical protein
MHLLRRSHVQELDPHPDMKEVRAFQRIGPDDPARERERVSKPWGTYLLWAMRHWRLGTRRRRQDPHNNPTVLGLPCGGVIVSRRDLFPKPDPRDAMGSDPEF